MTFTTLVNLIATIFYSLIATLGFVFWIIGTIHALIRDQRHKLRRSDVSSLVPKAAAATLSAMLVGAIYAANDAERNFIGAPTANLVLSCALIHLAVCGLLWLALLYLRLRLKEQRYLYLLPRDADQIRFDQCRLGIICMAASYPRVFADRETLDVFVRATSVSSSIHIFLKGKKNEFPLTNELSVYCTLAVEGFELGYYGFLALCQGAPDHLEATRRILQGWSASEEVNGLIDIMARQILAKQDQERKEE